MMLVFSGVMGFTAITAAVDSTTIVAGITALAAVKMAPGVGSLGLRQSD
jgi:hypothetical protein